MFKKLIKNKDEIFYTPCLGITGLKIMTYNNLLNDYAKIYFQILDNFNLEYYVFAGTSVGYVRNKSNIPWVDDYDIMIFESQINLFENIIVPFLKNMGFIHEIMNKKWMGSKILSEKIKLNEKHKGCNFLCDIFYSTVKKGIIRNLKINKAPELQNDKKRGWGLYDKKKLPSEYVFPSKRREIDGMSLPFFNKMEKDVELQYGDIINTCKIHVDHKMKHGITIKKHYSVVYKEFKKFKKEAIKRTEKIIFINKKYEGKEQLVLDNNQKYDSILNLLQHINKNDAGKIIIKDQKFLKYCHSIKYFFKKIEIIFCMMHEINKSNIMFLNYVDLIKFSNQDLQKKYDSTNIIYLKKPNFGNL